MAPGVAPPDTPAPRRYAELTGHWAIAVMALVVFHVYQFCNVGDALYRGAPAQTLLNALDAMVPWLFVIVAFLLFEPIARSAIEGRRPISARGLVPRGVLRLIPVYYVAVVVVWFARQHSLPGDWRDLLEHLTFTQVFDEKRIFYTIGPAWAVSVAVIFYVVLLALSVGLGRLCRRLPARRQRVAALAGGTAALAAVSVVWKASAWSAGHRPAAGSFTTYFGPVANLDIFAVGMGVAIVAAALGDTRPLGSRGRWALRLAAMAILVAAVIARQAVAWSAVSFPVVSAVAFGCLVAAAVLGPPGDRWARALSCGPLLWLGSISYGVYLWHEPLMLLLRGWGGLVRQAPGAFLPDVAEVLVASVLVGWLSYSLIERPVRRLARMFRRAERPLARPAPGTRPAEGVGRLVS